MSWFIIYSIFVLVLSAVAVILLFTLQMFQHTHFLPIFLLVVLYSFSIIMFAFMITPFFDKSRVRNVLQSFFFRFWKILEISNWDKWYTFFFIFLWCTDCGCSWKFRSNHSQSHVLYTCVCRRLEFHLLLGSLAPQPDGRCPRDGQGKCNKSETGGEEKKKKLLNIWHFLFSTYSTRHSWPILAVKA